MHLADIRDFLRCCGISEIPSVASVATAVVRTLGVFVMRSVLWSLKVSGPLNDLTADVTSHGNSVFTFLKDVSASSESHC